MEKKIERSFLELSLKKKKTKTIFMGSERNETLAIELELQLEKLLLRGKRKRLPNIFGGKFNFICAGDRHHKHISRSL